jgi:hypothetical protein
MIWFLFFIGVVWIMFGTLMIFALPVYREKFIARLKTLDYRTFGPVALAAGVLFFLASSHSKQPTFIIVLGLLSLVKGLALLFGPRDKMQKIVDWSFDASDQFCKAWGVFALGLGIAVLVTIVR